MKVTILFTVYWVQVIVGNVVFPRLASWWRCSLIVNTNTYRHSGEKSLFILSYCHSNMMGQHLGVRFSPGLILEGFDDSSS